MSLQSIVIKFAIAFGFIVFYFHYVQYINHYIAGTISVVESSLSAHSIAKSRTAATSQDNKLTPNSFRQILQDLQTHRNNITIHFELPSSTSASHIHESSSDSRSGKSSSDVANVSNHRYKANVEQSLVSKKSPVTSWVEEKPSSTKKVDQKPVQSVKKTKLKEKVTEFAKSHEMIDNSTPPTGIDLAHPKQSPRDGSDISDDSKRMELINCPHQSNCIVPALQLQPKLNVYLCKPPKRGGGVRFMYLVREGLMTHPNVHFMKALDTDKADYLVYLPGSGPWHKTECNETVAVGKSKLIVLDEFDGPSPLYEPYHKQQDMQMHYGSSKRWYNMYFKRSFVYRHDGLFTKYPHFKPDSDVYPLTYPLAEAYVRPSFNIVREIDILCTLRGSKSMSTRQRVQEWVTEYVDVNKVANAITKSLNKATRTSINKAYFEHMHNAKIIVTVNPAQWEGDFRLWESLASGALVFVDHLFVPHPYPLVNGVHIVYYNNHNKTELWSKLDYYLSHPQEAQKIAQHGYLHAMKYHRAVNLIDYVLLSTHLKHNMLQQSIIPKYVYSAQYLNYETIRQEKSIKMLQLPGKFLETATMYNRTHLVVA